MSAVDVPPLSDPRGDRRAESLEREVAERLRLDRDGWKATAEAYQVAVEKAEAEVERLRTENEQLRVVLRQVRGHTITDEAKRLIDRALRG